VLTRKDSERQAIAAALDAANGHRIRAAEFPGMSRTTLYRRVKLYGMD
jgi:transcriptional regulator of acetoin/glycerol metabolism